MKKKYILIGFVLLAVISVINSIRTTKSTQSIQQEKEYITLEGAFKKTGTFYINENMILKDVINEVGVKENANINAINQDIKVISEQSYYMPTNSQVCININTADEKSLRQLERIGEKMSQRIIEYRKDHPFQRLEEIMEIKGIGIKTFEKIRDHICL